MEHVKRLNFNRSIIDFTQQLFSSKSYALPKSNSSNVDNFIRVSRGYALPADHLIMNYVQRTYSSNVSFRRTCWKGRVKFSVFDPLSTGRNCDSCISFKNGQNTVEYGFIAANVSNAIQMCNIIVHKVRINHWDYLVLKKQRVVNPFIFGASRHIHPNW